MTDKKQRYNGWKNYETWNVALWIGNNEGLYENAKELGTYERLRDILQVRGIIETPDSVSYRDSGLDISALNEMISEL
jgi:hypothetical protein